MSFDLYKLPMPDLGLRCISCGYPLAALPSHRCPECGTDVDFEAYIPPGDFPLLIYEGREVLLTAEIGDALRTARIPFIHLMGPAEALYGLYSATHQKSRVGVPRGLYFDALYALRQRQLGVTSASGSVVADDWVCAHCREENPGNFELCWHCEAARGG